MFAWLRVQGFESSLNKVFQSENDVFIKRKTKKDIQSLKLKCSALLTLTSVCDVSVYNKGLDLVPE